MDSYDSESRLILHFFRNPQDIRTVGENTAGVVCSPQNFERLVIACMDSYDSESRLIFSAFFKIYEISISLHLSDLKFTFKSATFFLN